MILNKNLLILIIVFLTGLTFIKLNVNESINTPVNKYTNSLKKEIPIKNKNYVGEISKSIFVPYWSLIQNSNLNIYDRVIYFGIKGDENGIDTGDIGYKSLEKLNLLNFGKAKKYLTVRMSDATKNLKIVDESIEIAKQYGFSGIFLDLEISAIFGDEIIGQINNFSNSFYKKSKENNINYSIAIYGDVFYRKRPYDISNLAKNSDEIMIMAYDFHKSISEPGPNFPLQGRDIYGYDMEVLMDDFLGYTTAEKITVIFGMYGYDWIVDDKDRPIKPAQSLSLNQIKSKHSNDCIGERCEFVDEDKRRHIIWFENEESVSKKIEYLKSRGVGSFAYWANGYF